MNPYLNRVMIQDPKQFFGRRSEARRILSRIGADRPQSISVVGDRRIGKSSLLYYLACPDVQDQYLPDRSSLGIIFLDFQQLRNIALEDFFALLITRVRQVCGEVPDVGLPDYRAFQSLLDSLRRQKKKLVLLFDEFQAVTSNPAFKIEFYSFLRSMANNYAVAYVTSSSIELQRLCCSSDISDSPFFNIFSNLYLKPFESEEAHELITRPSEEQGAPLRSFAGEIVALAGLFPFYLQIACSIYFDFIKGYPGRKLDHEEVKSRFLEEAGPHFDYFWEHAAPEYQAVLEKMIQGEQPHAEEAYICQNLQRKGYVVRDSDGFRIFSPVFADHIRMLTNTAARARMMSPGGISVEGHPFRQGLRVQQYLILRKAGEGGMGVVYEAEDTTLERKVALKFIKPELLQQEIFRRRFLQEARAAARLSHPTIASVYELFELGRHFGLALEWIEGTTLKQRISTKGRVELSELAVWMIEACDGLDEAHRHGIIHRDIKSANLMITAQNHMKIMDFGLAKYSGIEAINTLASTTAEGTLIGTIDYMSPEQTHGLAADARSDLFSLGVVFFEAMTGQLPFKSDTALATLQAIANKPVPSLSDFRIESAGLLDSVVQKLLAKPPDERYASALEVKEEFKKLLLEIRSR